MYPNAPNILGAFFIYDKKIWHYLSDYNKQKIINCSYEFCPLSDTITSGTAKKER